MTIIAATALLYIACFGFYHANKRRTAFDWIKATSTRRKVTRYSGWLIAFGALGLLVTQFGWELGIPLWLAVFVFAGVSSLLISALWPKTHIPSAIVSVALLIISGAYLAIEGAV
ncbi:MAG: DUF3325 family protein [Pseudomonadota bacterium]